MDILTQKRITDNGDGAGYFKYCVAYAYKEKLDPGELRVETKGYGVSDTKDLYTYQEMYAVKEYYDKTGDNPVMHTSSVRYSVREIHLLSRNLTGLAVTKLTSSENWKSSK